MNTLKFSHTVSSHAAARYFEAQDIRCRISPPRRIQACPVGQAHGSRRRGLLDKPGTSSCYVQTAPEVFRFLQRQRNHESPLLRLDEGLGSHKLADL